MGMACRDCAEAQLRLGPPGPGSNMPRVCHLREPPKARQGDGTELGPFRVEPVDMMVR